MKLDFEPVQKHLQVSFLWPSSFIRPPPCQLFLEEDVVIRFEQRFLIGILSTWTARPGSKPLKLARVHNTGLFTIREHAENVNTSIFAVVSLAISGEFEVFYFAQIA
jgi:hypothetical protein